MANELDRNYMWEKLRTAVEILATEDGSVTERLASAFESHLLGRDQPMYPASSPLPRQLSDACKDLIREIGNHYRGVSNRSDLVGVSPEEAKELAARLVGIFEDVCRLSGVR